MRTYKIFIKLAIGLAILVLLLQMANVAKVLSCISMANAPYIFTAALTFIAASTMVALAFFGLP